MIRGTDRGGEYTVCAHLDVHTNMWSVTAQGLAMWLKGVIKWIIKIFVIVTHKLLLYMYSTLHLQVNLYIYIYTHTLKKYTSGSIKKKKAFHDPFNKNVSILLSFDNIWCIWTFASLFENCNCAVLKLKMFNKLIINK